MATSENKTGILLIDDERHIISDGITFIGRDSTSCAIVLANGTISKQHAQLIKINGNHYITDLKSTNGSKLNGITLKPHLCFELPHNSNISLGDMNCKFLIQEYNELFKTPTRLPKLFFNKIKSSSSSHDDSFPDNTQKLYAENDTTDFDLATQKLELPENLQKQDTFSISKLQNESSSKTLSASNHNNSLLERCNTQELSEVSETPGSLPKLQNTSNRLKSQNLSISKKLFQVNDKIEFDKSDDFIITDTQKDDSVRIGVTPCNINETADDSFHLELSESNISDSQMANINLEDSYSHSDKNSGAINKNKQRDKIQDDFNETQFEFEVDANLITDNKSTVLNNDETQFECEVDTNLITDNKNTVLAKDHKINLDDESKKNEKNSDNEKSNIYTNSSKKMLTQISPKTLNIPKEKKHDSTTQLGSQINIHECETQLLTSDSTKVPLNIFECETQWLTPYRKSSQTSKYDMETQLITPQSSKISSNIHECETQLATPAYHDSPQTNIYEIETQLQTDTDSVLSSIHELKTQIKPAESNISECETQLELDILSVRSEFQSPKTRKEPDKGDICEPETQLKSDAMLVEPNTSYSEEDVDEIPETQCEMTQNIGTPKRVLGKNKPVIHSENNSPVESQDIGYVKKRAPIISDSEDELEGKNNSNYSPKSNSGVTDDSNSIPILTPIKVRLKTVENEIEYIRATPEDKPSSSKVPEDKPSSSKISEDKPSSKTPDDKPSSSKTPEDKPSSSKTDEIVDIPTQKLESEKPTEPTSTKMNLDTSLGKNRSFTKSLPRKSHPINIHELSAQRSFFNKETDEPSNNATHHTVLPSTDNINDIFDIPTQKLVSETGQKDLSKDSNFDNNIFDISTQKVTSNSDKIKLAKNSNFDNVSNVQTKNISSKLVSNDGLPNNDIFDIPTQKLLSDNWEQNQFINNSNVNNIFDVPTQKISPTTEEGLPKNNILNKSSKICIEKRASNNKTKSSNLELKLFDIPTQKISHKKSESQKKLPVILTDVFDISTQKIESCSGSTNNPELEEIFDEPMQKINTKFPKPSTSKHLSPITERASSESDSSYKLSENKERELIDSLREAMSDKEFDEFLSDTPEIDEKTDQVVKTPKETKETKLNIINPAGQVSENQRPKRSRQRNLIVEEFLLKASGNRKVKQNEKIVDVANRKRKIEPVEKITADIKNETNIKILNQAKDNKMSKKKSKTIINLFGEDSEDVNKHASNINDPASPKSTKSEKDNSNSEQLSAKPGLRKTKQKASVESISSASSSANKNSASRSKDRSSGPSSTSSSSKEKILPEHNEKSKINTRSKGSSSSRLSLKESTDEQKKEDDHLVEKVEKSKINTHEKTSSSNLNAETSSKDKQNHKQEKTNLSERELKSKVQTRGKSASSNASSGSTVKEEPINGQNQKLETINLSEKDHKSKMQTRGKSASSDTSSGSSVKKQTSEKDRDNLELLENGEKTKIQTRVKGAFNTPSSSVKEQIYEKNKEKIKLPKSDEKLKLNTRAKSSGITADLRTSVKEDTSESNREIILEERKTRSNHSVEKPDVNQMSKMETVNNDSRKNSRRKRNITESDEVASVSTPEKVPRVSSSSSKQTKKDKYRIMFTLFRDEDQEKTVKMLGGQVVDKCQEANVLVTNQIRRSVKLLCAVSMGIPVVSPRWLEVCKQSKAFVDPWQYLLNDPAAEKKFSFNLRNSLNRAKNGLLLEGYTIFATKSIPEDMKDIVENCGATYSKTIPNRAFPEKSFVVSSLEDKNEWPQKKHILIVEAEAIFSSLIKQDLILEKHKLK